jgi:hypothetical protein
MYRAHCLRRIGSGVLWVVMAGAVIGCGEEEKSGTNNYPVGGAGGTGGVGGAGGTGGAGGAAGMIGGVGGTIGGIGGSAGTVAGVGGGGVGGGGVGGVGGGGAGGMEDPDAGMMDPDSGMGGAGGMGGGDSSCPDGEGICRGDAPTELTSDDGPFSTESYDLSGIGCVYYPTDAEPPFAAVAISDGYLGSGGCGRTQTSGWGPFYASHGIVAMIVETGSGDQPATRGARLLDGIEGFKAENEDSSSPLFGKLAGRYGTSGFSMGGGGTTHAAGDDPTLLSSVGLMAWRPVGNGMTVPTLFICGASDGTASCRSHSEPAYADVPDTTDKALITVSGGHVGQPTAGGGDSGAHALAFQKVYLEGDERWRPILLAADWDETNLE